MALIRHLKSKEHNHSITAASVASCSHLSLKIEHSEERPCPTLINKVRQIYITRVFYQRSYHYDMLFMFEQLISIAVYCMLYWPTVH